MKLETFKKKCRVSELVYNTVWLVNNLALYAWAFDNIKACEEYVKHNKHEGFLSETVQRGCIAALVKHAMRQALKREGNTYHNGPLVVTYKPERYLEFEFDYKQIRHTNAYIHTKTGIYDE